MQEKEYDFDIKKKKKGKEMKEKKNEAYRVLPLLSFSKLVNFSASHFIGNENAVHCSWNASVHRSIVNLVETASSSLMYLTTRDSRRGKA